MFPNQIQFDEVIKDAIDLIYLVLFHLISPCIDLNIQ